MKIMKFTKQTAAITAATLVCVLGLSCVSSLNSRERERVEVEVYKDLLSQNSGGNAKELYGAFFFETLSTKTSREGFEFDKSIPRLEFGTCASDHIVRGI
jgi:hypothetical protein